MRAKVCFDFWAERDMSADDLAKFVKKQMDFVVCGVDGNVRVSVEADDKHDLEPTLDVRADTANRLLCSHCLKEVGGELSTLCSFNGKRVCEGCSGVIDAGVDQHGYVVLSNAALKLLGEIHRLHWNMGAAGDCRDWDWCNKIDEDLDRAHKALREEMTK